MDSSDLPTAKVLTAMYEGFYLAGKQKLQKGECQKWGIKNKEGGVRAHFVIKPMQICYYVAVKQHSLLL